MNNLMRRMPGYYHKAYVMNIILDALMAEFQRLNAYKEKMQTEMAIDTASDKIGIYENSYGLPQMDDSLYNRRARVKGRMRGTGNISESEFINILLAYTGEADIEIDSRNSKIIVKLTDVWGIPPTNADIINTIEDYKPAHFIYKIEYLFTTWQAVSRIHETFKSAEAMTWLLLASIKEDE